MLQVELIYRFASDWNENSLKKKTKTLDYKSLSSGRLFIYFVCFIFTSKLNKHCVLLKLYSMFYNILQFIFDG